VLSSGYVPFITFSDFHIGMGGKGGTAIVGANGAEGESHDTLALNVVDAGVESDAAIDAAGDH
jgi:hypothetical protein